LPVMRIVLLPALPGRDAEPRPKRTRVHRDVGTKKDRKLLRP
jgi:hypothetical protein